jgi:hypothetical protein
MNNKDALDKKRKSLKSAIERYNEYRHFVDVYKSTKSLDEYIEHINKSSQTYSESLIEHYKKMIRIYNDGNSEPLLSSLYDRLLAADEYKQKITEELKVLLREL